MYRILIYQEGYYKTKVLIVWHILLALLWALHSFLAKKYQYLPLIVDPLRLHRLPTENVSKKYECAFYKCSIFKHNALHKNKAMY